MILTLAERMKMYEESTTSTKLMAKLPILIRLDGNNFSKFTADLTGHKKPFDKRLSKLMIDTTKYLVELTNAKIGFCQSDEITLLLYSDNIKSETYLNRRLFKIESILSAKCSVYFNSKLEEYLPHKKDKLPVFDCRAWNVPTKEEATNVFLWRERDCIKNSISMATQSLFSHNEVENMKSDDKISMLLDKGVDYNDYPNFFKRGSYIQRKTTSKKLTIEEIETLPLKHKARENPNLIIERSSYNNITMPEFNTVTNKIDVLFNGKDPTINIIK